MIKNEVAEELETLVPSGQRSRLVKKLSSRSWPYSDGMP
jgi:hypothetical protein